MIILEWIGTGAISVMSKVRNKMSIMHTARASQTTSSMVWIVAFFSSCVIPVIGAARVVFVMASVSFIFLVMLSSKFDAFLDTSTISSNAVLLVRLICQSTRLSFSSSCSLVMKEQAMAPLVSIDDACSQL